MRGDDELLELLGIMGGGHGDQSSEVEISGSHDTRSPRKAAAAPAAPAAAAIAASTDESKPACVPETGWNRSIWNPHVVDEAASAAAGVHLGVEGSAYGVGIGEVAVRPVSPQEEVLRQQAVAVVFARFQVLGKELGIRAKNEMFERWQFSRKLKEGRGGDPILPAESFFDPGLDAELRELGVHKSQSKNLCCELGRASKSALKTLRKQLRGVVNTPAGASKKRVAAKRLDDSTYVLQLGKNKLRMNSAHYDKMKELFSRACVNGGKKSLPSRSSATGVALSSSSSRGALPLAAWAGDFHDSLFACLMRYEALQGGGFQASMGGDAFDVLLRHLGVKMECFASPFNCRYSRYCSAFEDTDKPFGSVGSFFDFQPTEGAYEANPPFVRDVILKMANHMDGLLQATSKALTFVVIIPFWEDSVGWKRLRDSAFLSKHVKLDQKDHGYCEGKQHLRRNRYRLASFHTSVFFLETEAARLRRKAGTLEQACQELEQAFAMRQEADGGGGGGGGAGAAPSGDSTTRAGSGGRGGGGGGGGGDAGPPCLEVDVNGDSDGGSGRQQQQELPSPEDGRGEEDEAGLLSPSTEENDGGDRDGDDDGETRVEEQCSKKGGVLAAGGVKRSREGTIGDAAAGEAGAAAATTAKAKNRKKRIRDKGKHPQRSDGEARASPVDRVDQGRGDDTRSKSAKGATSTRDMMPSGKVADPAASISRASEQLSVKKKRKRQKKR